MHCGSKLLWWSRCEWSNLVLLKLKGLESIRLDVAKVVEMHFNGVRSPDDELETTKHTTSYLPPMKVDLARRLFSTLLFAISLRIATSSKQRFWITESWLSKTSWLCLAWPGIWHALTCFDSTCWFQPVRSGLKSGLGIEANRRRTERTPNLFRTTDDGTRLTYRTLQAKCSAKGSSLLAPKGVGNWTYLNMRGVEERQQFA